MIYTKKINTRPAAAHLRGRRIAVVFFLMAGVFTTCFAQRSDSTAVIHHFSGSANLTNNGISLVPSFSLGRPAVIFLLSLGGERFSIDPDIRFGLNGKPWTFLFWARYKVVKEGRFRFHTGTHLGLNFQNSQLQINGTPSENVVVRRYLAGELAPSYNVTKNFSVGSYYLVAKGLDAGTVKQTHFVTLNAHLSHLPVTRQLYLRVAPQVFYLNQDGKTGRYFTTVVTLAKNNFPLSFSTLVNKTIDTEIAGSKEVLWSFSLIYSFNRNYVPRQPAL